MTFEEFQEIRELTDSGFLGGSKMIQNEILSEGIIIPPNFSIKSTDINYLLNEPLFKELGVEFDDSSSEIYYERGKIFIGTEGIRSKSVLASKIGHELVHKMQDIKSSGKFISWAKALHKEFSSKPYVRDAIKQQELLRKINFQNNFERMAYAYEFSSLFDEEGIDNALNNINKLFPEFRGDKQFMKYLYQYFEYLNQNKEH